MLSGSSSSSAAPAVFSPAPLQRARSLGAPRLLATFASAVALSRRPEREQLRATRRRGNLTKAMAAATDDDAGGAPSPSAPSAAAPNVAELVMLLKIDPDEDANAVLDELWSAQYLAPGTLCAFAGETMATSQGDFTHALHMRFPDAAAAAAFIGHGAFSAAAERASQASAGGGGGAGGAGGSPPPPPRPSPPSVVLAVFPGRVDPASLETLFRRGPEWESGIEHVLLLSSRSGSGSGSGSGSSGGGGSEEDRGKAGAEADLYVSQLRELAESSLVGAVQSTSGRVVPVPSSPHCASSGSPHLAATHAILTRFAGPEQLRAFLALPPVRALLSPSPPAAAEGGGGAGSGGSASPPPPLAPVRAVASACYNIAPAQGVTGKQAA